MRKPIRTFLIIALISLSLPFRGAAQKDSTLEKRIGAEFCAEFSKADLTKMEGENWQVELGLLILPLFDKYAAEIQKEWNIDPKDPDMYEKVGEKIGQIAALKCPAFQEFILKNMDKINGEDKESEKSLDGKWIKTEQTGMFSYLLVRTKAGKEEKFWWFEFFEGADELLSRPESYKNSNINIRYRETEVYDASLKEYRKIKVITRLTRSDN